MQITSKSVFLAPEGSKYKRRRTPSKIIRLPPDAFSAHFFENPQK
jgi:hypothetical protein